MDKETVIMLFCYLIFIVTTLYLWNRLYEYEKLAWGLWGLAILAGTMTSERMDRNKEKRK